MRPSYLQIGLAFAASASTISATVLPSSLLKRAPPNCNDRYGTVTSSDCLNAISYIGPGGSPQGADHVEHTFYTQFTTYSSNFNNPATYADSVDITTPMKWQHGECAVVLRMISQTDRETSIWYDIQHAAQVLHDACTYPNLQGGTINVGDMGERMQILIYLESEDTDDVSDTDPSGGQCPLEAAIQQQDVTSCFLGGIAGGSGKKGRK